MVRIPYSCVRFEAVFVPISKFVRLPGLVVKFILRVNVLINCRQSNATWRRLGEENRPSLTERMLSDNAQSVSLSPLSRPLV